MLRWRIGNDICEETIYAKALRDARILTFFDSSNWEMVMWKLSTAAGNKFAVRKTKGSASPPSPQIEPKLLRRLTKLKMPDFAYDVADVNRFSGYP